MMCTEQEGNIGTRTQAGRGCTHITDCVTMSVATREHSLGEPSDMSLVDDSRTWARC
jgi:hypothetical protein